MKKTILITVVVTALCIGLGYFAVQFALEGQWKPRPEGMPTDPPSGEDWVNLLAPDQEIHWKNITDDNAIFEIKDGQLHLFGKSLGKLRYAGYTAREFSDFELHVEFKLAKRTNSGVFLRVKENDPVRRGFEIQVLDDHGKVPCRTGTGSIYDMACPMYNLARPAGEWNSYDIRVQGKEVKVTVNGWKVIDTDFSLMTTPLGKFPIAFSELPLEGMLALQDHGGEVWYRNIYIRPL
ncbi:MAG: 3-keto-disaccharide hydrolase [Candidatus Hydrogenedentales bacterium]|jgi:hypothetical protein